MSWTAHKEPEQIREHIESPEEIERKAKQLADWIRHSRYFIAFTGAGVSTSAGIPDFRGPEGVWTLRDQGRQRTGKTVSSLQAIPTPTHMALVELQNRGFLKYLVSQNCDGLHRKSGILPQYISELHGNSNREVCSKCGKEYIRDYQAVASYRYSVHDHRTGRTCAKCGGDLHDSIINFGESLPRVPLQKAYENSQRADLCLVLGSSLTVSPAKNIPEVVAQNRGKLVICNLQKTPLDSMASLRIFAKTDDLMKQVMHHLDLPIPPFILHRRLVVECTCSRDTDRTQLKVYGVDVDGTPVSFLQSIEVGGGRADTEPFVFNFRSAGVSGTGGGTPVEMIPNFMGWYGEPPLKLQSIIPGDLAGTTKTTYLLDYNPMTGEWKVREEGGATQEAPKASTCGSSSSNVVSG